MRVDSFYATRLSVTIGRCFRLQGIGEVCPLQWSWNRGWEGRAWKEPAGNGWLISRLIPIPVVWVSADRKVGNDLTLGLSALAVPNLRVQHLTQQAGLDPNTPWVYAVLRLFLQAKHFMGTLPADEPAFCVFSHGSGLCYRCGGVVNQPRGPIPGACYACRPQWLVEREGCGSQSLCA